MLQAVQPRRRVKKRLSFAESVRLMQSVRQFLPGDSYGRTLKLAEIFGCDRRTARRLLNSADDDLPCLRRVYLVNASKYTGVPTSALLHWRPSMPELQRRLEFIVRDDIPTLDRFKEMSLMAASMAARCMFGYAMPASYTVECDTYLEPMAVHLRFRKNESLTDQHVISLIRVQDIYKWRMVYNHDELGNRFRGVINDENFERILNFIKTSNDTKK